MHSPNLTDGNIARIRELFPGCVTEARDESGTLKLAVDFDQLKQELSDSIVEGPQERYHLNWPGKCEALLTANAPIAKTLRPCREESVDFDTTKNLFIEGDNLDALKLLQETYLGKVKMIYIDSPYVIPHTSSLDTGFRVLKIDSSNMAEVYYTPDAVNQGDLFNAVDNIKPDRKPEDLLFQVLLDAGVDLSLTIRKETIQEKTVFFVDENALVACFDTDVNEELVRELAQFRSYDMPIRKIVFRDNGFASDAVKINVEQIFRQLSPGTEVKSI